MIEEPASLKKNITIHTLSEINVTTKPKIKPIIGANLQNNTCSFTVWAPNRKSVKLQLHENDQRLDMHKLENGYWTLNLENIKDGTLYNYELDNQIIRPDPASCFQPNGVFGPSMIVDQQSFSWADSDWKGLDFKDLIFYEAHVGAFRRMVPFYQWWKEEKS